MGRKAVLYVVAVLVVVAIVGIAGDSPDSRRGESAERRAEPAELSPEEVRQREFSAARAVRRGGIDARDVLSVLRAPADKLPGWVSRMPQTRLKGGAAKRLRVARGVPKTWILTDRSGVLVALAYDYGTSWFLGADILTGRVLSVYQEGAAVAVTGVLPDGTQEASISTGGGARTLRLRDGVYSERFATTARALPRVLTFTDARGTHTVRIPLAR
jgi:hypothetical protein